MTMNKMPESTSIMVVDDTPANLKLLQEMLQAKGYLVLTFTRGASALKAVAKNPPDLILLDINMPEMNGFEVCERLKADEVLKDIPVIFISALTETADKIKAFAVGGVDYITKPFQFEEVNARVETHLRLRRQQLELQALNELKNHLNPDISPSRGGWLLSLFRSREALKSTGCSLPPKIYQ